MKAAGQDYEVTFYEREIHQYVGYYAEVHKPVDYPLTQLAVTDSMDGTILRSFTVDDIGTAACFGRSVGTNQIAMFYLCSVRRPDGSGTTVLRYQTAAGDVTYFSRGYDVSWHQSPDGTATTDSSYSWNRSGTSNTNNGVPWGATYTVDVTLTAGDTVYHGPLTMMLQRDTMLSESQPWHCNESSGDWGWKRSCEEYTDLRVFVSGAAWKP